MIQKIKDFLGFDVKQAENAMADDPIFGKVPKAKKPDFWVRSTCGYCGVGCGLYIGVKDKKAVFTKGDPTHPVNIGTLCPKGLSENQMLYAQNRVLYPKIKKGGRLENVGWNEAFSEAAKRIKTIQSTYGKNSFAVISTGQLLTEEFYALGKFVQLGLDTRNYDGNTTLCMASAVSGYKQSFGSDGPVASYADIAKAEVVFVVGANLADNHPIIVHHLMKNRNNKTVVVIDPRRSKTSQLADIYLPIKPRTDLALFNGLAYIIWEQGWFDEKFITSRTNGWSEFVKHIQSYKPAEVAHLTGIDTKTLYRLAQLFANNKSLICWTMGINQSAQGTDTVSAINNLALMTGNIGKEGTGAFSITGQCNAMGTREFGFTSSIPGYRKFESHQDRKEFAKLIDVPVEWIPDSRGYKYAEIIEAIEKEEIKGLWVICTNPLVSFPNQKRLRKALQKLNFLLVQDAFMSDTAQIADIVFAAATWGEKEGCYTNSERRCNKANKAVEPPAMSKSDFDIVLEFSKYFQRHERLFGGWKEPKDAFEEIRKISRGRLCDYSGMNYEKIESLGGIQWPCNEQYPNGCKRLYGEDMKFMHKDGKARFICAEFKPLEEAPNKEFPFILNTGRTVEHFHTRTKTGQIKILNDLAPQAWIDINPKDAKKLGVKNYDRVWLTSPRGKVENLIVRVTQLVAPGTVFVPFHYNTQLINTLTQSLFDPISGEPNYKQTAVQIHSKKCPGGITPTVKIAGELALDRKETKQKVTVKEEQR
ncbi:MULTISPECIES: molybdopterin oxidoreductase family protein [unclassified Nitratiruptor]|uniref:molybdopterin oxidoreductase family protein n=1 Tax=unclassified Nitratiruptor TaxID=2624044 RepID=UPI00191527C4|nr:MULTISPECIES: nitrate reductase [unclassified Nitratiruptor]BCD59789.1 assimilatory nitrate reductase catalytic subunit [Nitratiruptor sp. YY08-10]BCD63713.1 assimilatory nitrate reductase catalytic subunit [Nitratiruptor sp. YY08-14]